MTTHTTRCPFCREPINAATNPLRFSGRHDLGCARCNRTRALKVARAVRPAVAGFTLNGGKAGA